MTYVDFHSAWVPKLTANPFFQYQPDDDVLKLADCSHWLHRECLQVRFFFFLVTCHNCQTNILHRNGLKVQAHVLSAAKLSEAVRVGQHRIIIIFIIIIRTNMAPIGGAMIMEVLALLGQERLVTVDR